MLSSFKEGNPSVFSLSGEMTIYVVNKFRDDFLKAIDNSDELVVDLSEVSEIDTTGFQVLAYAKKYCDKNGKSLEIVNHSNAIIDVFEQYGSTALFGDPIVIKGSDKPN